MLRPKKYSDENCQEEESLTRADASSGNSPPAMGVPERQGCPELWPLAYIVSVAVCALPQQSLGCATVTFYLQKLKDLLSNPLRKSLPTPDGFVC